MQSSCQISNKINILSDRRVLCIIENINPLTGGERTGLEHADTLAQFAHDIRTIHGANSLDDGPHLNYNTAVCIKLLECLKNTYSVLSSLRLKMQKIVSDICI